VCRRAGHSAGPSSRVQAHSARTIEVNRSAAGSCGLHFITKRGTALSSLKRSEARHPMPPKALDAHSEHARVIVTLRVWEGFLPVVVL
jgi:hypothetical protein